MNLSLQAFEVLQTLGYPLYVRRSLLTTPEKKEAIVTPAAVPPKSIERTSSAEEVKKLAVALSARSSLPQHTIQKTVPAHWPEFHLALLSIPNELLVLFDVPKGVEAKDPATLQLLGKMLSRCGVKEKPSFLKGFRWPLFPRNGQIDQSMQVAETAVASVVHKEQAVGRWKWLLILGENATSVTLHKAIDSVVGLEAEYLGVRTIVSLSVEELLLEPELRKATWQHLLPLRASYGKV